MRLAILLLAACGRVAFDPTSDATDLTNGAPDIAADVAGQTIAPGAKIWLEMNGAPDAGIVDSAGAHTVYCNGTCPIPVTGRHDGGFKFNGEGVVVDYRSDLDSSAGFTGAIWINVTSAPAGIGCAWVKSFDASNGFDTFNLTVTNTGASRFDGETPGGAATTDLGPILPLGEWHHLAITWDGTVRRNYFDGAQVGMTTTQLGVGVEQMELGFARGTFYIDAVLDDALYYTRALTPAEVAQLASP